MIQCAVVLKSIQSGLKRSRIVVLAGPRQCGKTTLARQLLAEDSVNYFDLEDPASLARLDEYITSNVACGGAYPLNSPLISFSREESEVRISSRRGFSPNIISSMLL
jgi:hypothetical protein